jgi:hypothetical protein
VHVCVTLGLTATRCEEKKYIYTRSTTVAVKPRSRANRVKKRRLEVEQQEEAKNKFVLNVPKLLLEVSLSQFPFPTIKSQIFGVNEGPVPRDMRNYFEY